MKETNQHKANHLINESSPYLLQHAYNPVDWYPWGQEALDKARQENKLLIISVGYAACHWCHVMEHESFEDSAVARIMNEHFVSIKVDREERPDVDDIYMTAAQLISGRGGWPLNAIALPDGRPVYAGTYYPKSEWINILEQIIKIRNEQPERLEETASQLTGGISQTALIEVADATPDYSLDEMKNYMDTALEKYDKTYGGRSGAPKFPMPNSYEFMMKYHWLTGDETSWKIVETSLDNMAYGGIYDQLGGGFARYSVDAYWLVPHFEKMLYDNAQLVTVYSQAYKLSGKELYRRIVDETLEFVNRELTSPEKAFYSSLDADSEGEEGKFYVWQVQEVDSLIKDETTRKLFKKHFNISKGGNWEGKNILNIIEEESSLAREFDLSEEEVKSRIAEARGILMEARSKRVRPGLDDKILTSWNALMISGLTEAYEAFGDERYLERAVEAGNFIINKQKQKDGRLNRNYKDGKSSINAFLDDYALTAQAFLDLYQVTFDESWIAQAKELVEYAYDHFYNEEIKMFNYTSKLDPPLIAQKAEFNDNVIPASNSSMARVLFTLGNLIYNTDYIDQSHQMASNMIAQINSSDYLSFYSNWLQLLTNIVKSPYEVAIVGRTAEEEREKIASHYLGNSIILGSDDGGSSLALLEDKFVEDATMIYVCQNKVCKLPVSDTESALSLIVP